MTTTERIELRVVELEQEVEILQAQIAGLRRVLDDEDRDRGNGGSPAPPSGPADEDEEDGGDPGAEDPPPPPAKRRAGVTVARGSLLKVAKALASGPLSRAEIAARAGLSSFTVGYALADPGEWFEMTETRRGSPWQLTEAGRAALNAAG